MASPIWGGAYSSLFLGHSAWLIPFVLVGEIRPRAAGREAGRAEFTPPLLVSDLCYSQWKTVPEKALAISGADRFTRRGGTCRLHAMFMNQLSVNLGVSGGIVKHDGLSVSRRHILSQRSKAGCGGHCCFAMFAI